MLVLHELYLFLIYSFPVKTRERFKWLSNSFSRISRHVIYANNDTQIAVYCRKSTLIFFVYSMKTEHVNVYTRRQRKSLGIRIYVSFINLPRADIINPNRVLILPYLYFSFFFLLANPHRTHVLKNKYYSVKLIDDERGFLLFH